MLLNAKTLNTYDVDASDGPAGTLVDSRFDEIRWELVDLVVNTRSVVSGRKVLVPVGAVRELDPERQKLCVALLQEQIDHAPSKPDDTAADSGPKSTHAAFGCHIRSRDDTFGHLEDMLIEPENWAIRYLLIDTRNWWPGPPVLVAPDWVSHFDWAERKLTMDVPAERIKRCPPYDPSAPLSRDYEVVLYRHYERAGYWRQG
jgi:hypothetical protein